MEFHHRRIPIAHYMRDWTLSLTEPWLGDVVPQFPPTSHIDRVWVSFGEVAQPMIQSSIDSWSNPPSLPSRLRSPHHPLVENMVKKNRIRFSIVVFFITLIYSH